MFKFNSENIFVGQIKQKLATFNLPKYRIYTKEQEEYALENKGKEIDIVPTIYTNTYPSYSNRANMLYDTQILYAPYIKDEIIQEYVKLGENTYEWRPHHFNLPNHDSFHDFNKTTSSNIKPFLYDTKELNYTKNLQIKNNIYDSYTHEYLGDYLRFHRDYNRINLMSLYNCFSNRVADDLKLEFSAMNNLDSDEINVVFDTSDKSYKILMIPVKMFKEYTIAMQCSSVVELCCGMYGSYQDKRSAFINLPTMTYTYYNNLQFNTPVLFNKLLYNNLLNANGGGENLISSIAQSESNLKLFIKIPANTITSIVVLEGNYLDYNETQYSIINSRGTRKTNYSVINFEKPSRILSSGLKSPLQLLQINTGESYPFADRLIEYLSENVITPIDTIGDNIKRVKAVATLVTDSDTVKQISAEGVWNSILTPILYNQIINKHNTFKDNRDILGYVDKTTERNFKYVNNKTDNSVTLANVDIYEAEDKTHEWQ